MERKGQRDNEGGQRDSGGASSYRTRKNTALGVGTMAAIAFGFNLALDAFTKLKEGESIPAPIEAVSKSKHEADIAAVRGEIRACNDKISSVQGTVNTINSILIGKALK